MTQQRLRLWFSKSERVRYISHLDVLRFWERSIRRAGLPLAYSQGFTPHPRIAFAGPLPLGFASEAELMDVTLEERVDPAEFRTRLEAELSADFAITGLEEIPLSVPPPQAALLWADYRVELPGLAIGEARQAVTAFLGRDSFEWTEERRDRARTYDLRQAVARLEARKAGDVTVLEMRLQATQELTARPEQLAAALFPGREAGLITRTGLVLEETSPAREAWRRKGQYQS